MSASADPVVILSAARTPLGRFMGELSPFSAHKLGAHVIGAALERAKLAPERIDEVFMGNVLPAGQGQAPARQAARGAKLPDATGATTINKVCGSGMKATMLAHDIINAGSASIVLSGGMESMSNAPYLLAKARGGYRAGHDRILDHMMMDGLEDAYETGRSMGDFGEATAEAYQFTRADQDKYAMETLTRARKAVEGGAFKTEIAPITLAEKAGLRIIANDEHPLKVDPAKIPGLKPAFPSCICERKRNRAGRRIPVTVDIDNHFLLRNAEFLRRILDDAHVCLMGNVHIHILNRAPALGQHGLRRRDEHPRRELEDLAAVHLDEVQAVGDGLLRGR